jgi:hypothetical protein
MAGWRAWIDRGRLSRVQLCEVGVAGAWDAVHGLDQQQRRRCFDFAAQAIVRYERLIDKPMMTGDIIWRCAYIGTAEVLEREYRANLIESHEYESSRGRCLLDRADLGSILLWSRNHKARDVVRRGSREGQTCRPRGLRQDRAPRVG